MSEPDLRHEVRTFLDYVNKLPGQKAYELPIAEARAMLHKSRQVADAPVGEQALIRDFEAPGPAGARQYLMGVFAALPDFHATIEDIVAEGDRVVVRNVWRGTHLGSYHGVPPTGNSIALKGIVIFRIADGKIAERWATLDELALMRQLGLIERPGIIPGGPAAA